MAGVSTLARQLVVLSKPRIIVLLVLTAVCGLYKAAEAEPAWDVRLAVTIAGALAAAGSNAINQGLDSDIDAVMRRTRRRPVPAAQMSRNGALTFGALAIALAVAGMGLFANWLAAWLTLAAAAVYVLVYTVLLKRRSWNSIVIGGAAGAFPPLIGAATVTGQIEAVGLYMFALVFFWTPPHFWTLSILLRDDYAAAKVPMLASIASQRDTAIQIVLYIVLLVAMAWLPVAAGYAGVTFGIVTTLISAWWLRKSLPLLRDGSRATALSAYKFSLLWLAIVFLVLAAEPALPWY